MKAMKRVCLFAVAAILAGGCAKTREQNGYARHPELKAGASARGSNRKQEAPQAPRILPETNYAAGRIFEQQGSPEKAIDQYRKAIAVNHGYTAAYARLGLMLSVTGQHEESVAAFAKAVELKPASAILRNNLGFELLYVERWAEAERHLREAVRLDTRLAQAHINLGLLLGRTQRDEQAVESFRKVLPEPDAYYNLGLLQRAQGRHAQALESFRHVLTINPEFNAAQRQLVQVERKITAAATAPSTVAVTDPVVPDHATQTGPPAPATTGHAVVPPLAPAPFVDLGALIDQLISMPKAQTNPVTEQGPTPASVVAQEEAAAEKETPTARTTMGASIEPSDQRIQTEPAVPAPTVQANPEPVGLVQHTEPLRWDLTLSDMANALKVTDELRSAESNVQEVTELPGPVQSEPNQVLASLMGPPAPTSEEVTLVLGTSETKPLELESIAVSTSSISAHGQKTMRTMDEMEISLQIIRNEIQCQKDHGAGNAERSTPMEPQTTNPDQRTLNWRNDFEALDNVLAAIRTERPCPHDSTLAQKSPAPSPDENTKEEAQAGSHYGPALQSPPISTPRRARWSNRDKRSGK